MIFINKPHHLFCIFIFFFSSLANGQQDITIKIGVMSPKYGPQRTIGEAHDFWVKLALTSYGKIVNEQGVIRIKAIYKDTKSNESDSSCLEQAEELIAQGALLIIGPVSSGCVASVLSGDLQIPIITTLASATFLTEKRSSWFFRANGYDKIRMQKLWKHIDVSINHKLKHKWIVVHDTSEYGKGLLSDLKATINSAFKTKIIKIPQDETQVIFQDSTVTEVYKEDDFINFIVLGQGDKVIKTLNEINEFTKKNQIPHQIYTVGSSINLLNNSPKTLITVGEMQIDQTHKSKFTPEIERMVQQAMNRQHSFYPTTYQTARFIVPTAIHRALKDKVKIPEINTLRKIIRQELENGEFDSIQPPKRVEFNEGNMNEIFEFPIYQVNPVYTKIKSAEGNIGWVEFLSETAKVNYMESPLKVTLVGHQLNGEQIKLSLYRNGEELIKEKKIKLTNDKKVTIPFHVNFPGSYHIVSNISSYPEEIEYKVSFSPLYFICILSAFLAVFLKQKMTKISWVYRIELLAEGALIGIAVAFISTYIQYSVLPFTATDWNLINGLLYGFIGGWFGPLIITSLTNRVLPGSQ